MPTGTASMSDKYFVDTNILIYSQDASEPHKQPIARKLLEKLWNERSGSLSVQVLNEYFVNVTRKIEFPLTPQEAWSDVQAFQAWHPTPLTMELMERSHRLHLAHSLSWWDSLIVSAAQASCCTLLYSEDLSHNAHYDQVRICNPFF